MNAAVGAAAAPTPIEAWMRAAFTARIWNEPWELRGALDVLWEFFSQIIPKLKVEDDSFRVGIQRLNRINARSQSKSQLTIGTLLQL